MRKPSKTFVHTVLGKLDSILNGSAYIQSSAAFKSSTVRASEFGKAVLILTTFIICGLVPLSASAAEPVPPQDVSASDGTYLDIIRVTWADVTDETSYEVFRCDTDIDSSCASVDILPADTIQFDDMGGEIIGGNHYYRVKSCIVDICSEYSATDPGYTQLVFESGLEVDSIAITDFDIDGQSNVTLQPGDPATLDWSTSNAQGCVASSSPELDVWNSEVSISTYGQQEIFLSAETVADTYELKLTCMSALLETSKQVTLTVTTEPEAPTLDSVLGEDESARLFFTANGDGGEEITSFKADCDGNLNTGAASPIVVGGLINGTVYSCTVTAINDNGPSAPSDPKNVTPTPPIIIENFRLTTDKDPEPISCGDVEVTLAWDILNEDPDNRAVCYGSWRKSEENPQGEIPGNLNSDIVLIEDLPQDEVFTLRCDDDQTFDEDDISLSVKAPCLPTTTRLWSEMFTVNWPNDVGRIITQINRLEVLAIEFNTGEIETVGTFATLEFSSSRGKRLVAISTKKGDFQVADQCRAYHNISGTLSWETGENNQYPNYCKLDPKTVYYWNTTFSDGINTDSGTCDSSSCLLFMKSATPYEG